MKIVWKYPLEVTDKQKIVVPYGSVFLCVKEQNDAPVVYVLVDTTYSIEPCTNWDVYIFGTGHQIDSTNMLPSDYVGTVTTYGGSLVWHIWIGGKGVDKE